MGKYDDVEIEDVVESGIIRTLRFIREHYQFFAGFIIGLLIMFLIMK